MLPVVYKPLHLCGAVHGYIVKLQACRGHVIPLTVSGRVSHPGSPKILRLSCLLRVLSPTRLSKFTFIGVGMTADSGHCVAAIICTFAALPICARRCISGCTCFLFVVIKSANSSIDRPAAVVLFVAALHSLIAAFCGIHGIL